MNEAPPDQPLWKRFWHTLCKHGEDWIALGIISLITGGLAWSGGKLWQALLDSIQAYPAQTVCLVALGTTIFVSWKMYLYRSIANLERAKSSEVDVLKGELAREKGKVSKLEAASAASSKPSDPLSLSNRHIVTCILGAGEITIHELATELNLHEAAVVTLVKELCYTHQFVARIDIKQSVAYYGLTEQGIAYSIEQGIAKVEQKVGEMRFNKAQAEELRKQREEEASRKQKTVTTPQAFWPASGSAGTKPTE